MAIYNPNDLLYFDVLEGRPIWACAYKIDNQTGRSILRQVPVQGEIRGTGFMSIKRMEPCAGPGTSGLATAGMRTPTRRWWKHTTVW